MRTVWNLALVAAAAVILGGCALLARPRGGVAWYAPTLSASTAPSIASSHRAPLWQIEVAEPQTPASHLGTRILVSPEPGSVEVYRDARWQDPPAIMLQALFVQGLGDTGIAGAAGNASLQHADFLLESDLLRFQAEYRGAVTPTASIRVHARLIRVADGSVVAAQLFAVDEPAAASPVPSVIEAFVRAIDRLVREVALWTVRAGDDAWAASH